MGFNNCTYVFLCFTFEEFLCVFSFYASVCSMQINQIWLVVVRLNISGGEFEIISLRLKEKQYGKLHAAKR